MGKAKRLKISLRNEHEGISLVEQIENESFARPSARNKQRNHQTEQDYVDSKLSRKILAEAARQQRHLGEDGDDGEVAVNDPDDVTGSRHIAAGDRARASDQEELASSGDDNEMAADTAICQDVVIDAADERAIEQFLCRDAKPRRVLADIIMEKIREKETEIGTQMSDANNSVVTLHEIDARVRQMYDAVRVVLAKYRTGKLPKAFKVIPNLHNWEQMLYLTRPESWSAAAMYQATRMFAANLAERQAQRFYNLVLLPRVRDDIHFYRRLNPHLYLALKKALFKPGAFMKGLLLPLCESGDCTLREAIIIGSVLTRCSVPVLHASAALLKMAAAPSYTPAASLFMRVLLDKQYALPYRVIDTLHAHFMRFHLDERLLPVLWHQCLLVLVRRYASDMAVEQRELLVDLTNTQRHDKITPEIRRELLSIHNTRPVNTASTGDEDSMQQ